MQTQKWMMASYFNLPEDEIFYYKLSQDYILPFTHHEDGSP